MKPRLCAVVLLAILAGAIYGGWLSYRQWHWYLGWPRFTYAQGLAEFGWPISYLDVSTRNNSPLTVWRWNVRNLFLNSAFCAILSVSVSFVSFKLFRSLSSRDTRWQFSLATLLLVTLSVGLTFGLWQVLYRLPVLGADRWGYPLAELEIPRSLATLVSTGLFCLAYSVATIVLSVPALIRRRQPISHPVAG